MVQYGSCSNVEEYRNVDIIPIDVLWSIRHIKSFRWGTILCILFMVVFLVYTLAFYEPLLLSFMAILLIVSMSLNFMYNHTLKFADVVNALNMDITNLEVVKLNTLKFSTLSHGDFTLYYDNGGKYSNPYYKLWITTQKSLPNREYEDLDKWNEDTFYQRFGEKNTMPLPGYVSLSFVADIKSLREIRFEWGSIINKIVATLDDEWLYSETYDILRTIKILRGIEKNLK